MAYITFQPNDYFNTLLYSGNSTARSLTGVGFEPSFTWIKERTSTSDHMLFDQPRGVQKYISSNLNNQEQTSATMLTAFGSDGFSLGNGNDVNDNGQTYASWNWKANGQGSSNTDGSINTTYTSANTTSGFSISTYTGTGSNATVGHGLGAVPKVVLVKGLGHTSQWYMYHVGTGAGKVMFLDNTASQTTDTTSWQNTTPTSSVFSIGNDGGTNGSSNTYVAYCFAEKKGFSKFGSYVGNGNANGAFVYTGFKPAFLLLKNASDGAKNWEMIDNRRPSTGQNPADDILFPDTSDSESSSQTDRLVDFVSNGVKIRGNSAQMNGNGNTHIFMAFAEEPLVSSNGVAATAR